MKKLLKYNIENKYDSEIFDLEKNEIFYTKLYENYFKTPLLNENIIKICIEKDPESVLKCFRNYPEYKINDENYVKESLKWIKAVDFNPWSVSKEIIQKYLSPMEMFFFVRLIPMKLKYQMKKSEWVIGDLLHLQLSQKK